MQPFLEEKREEIAELCRTHHVRRLAVFGSAVRDDFDPEKSDVDFLVEFDHTAPDWRTSADNRHSLEEKLEALLGRDVDLVRNGAIENPFILRRIREQEQQLYAA
jgi:predicted nucleotidyltransferase